MLINTVYPSGAAFATGAPVATGVFYERQEVGAIREAVIACERAVADGRITAAACRGQAERFSVAAFRDGVRAAVDRVAQRLVLP